MRDILDLGNRWTGTVGGAIVAGNKAPVAIDDTLSLLMDSSPVSVAVLANDVDPEGQPLTLISATAALGTAVAEADNTVTYTPPAGVSGFDTVVYEIADDLDQRRNGQINVTITEPVLSVAVQPDNTFVVSTETGIIDITVTTPTEFAGTYQVDTADLGSGPINLVPPAIAGTVAAGQMLTADPGLWIYDAGAGSPGQNWQWRLAGTDIPGETSASYTVQASDIGQNLSVTETLTDSFGQRSTESASVGGLGAPFQPSNDTGIIAWFDASDAATITETAGMVSAWADKAAGGAALEQSVSTRQPLTGVRSQNGLNVLDFDGAQYLDRALTLPASGDVALHMAVIIDSVSSEYAAVVALDAANDMQLDAAASGQFDGRLNVTGIGTTTPLTGGPFSGALILSLIFDQSGAATAEVFIADTTRASMTYTTALDPAVGLHVMTNRARNASLEGGVCEIVITNSVGNRTDYYTYLAAKWGIA